MAAAQEQDSVIADAEVPSGSGYDPLLESLAILTRLHDRAVSPEALARQERFAFIPFAAGHRNCIGAAMAMVELKLVMTQIAQRFVLTHDSAHRIVPTAGTVMHPRGGMPMFIRRRQP